MNRLEFFCFADFFVWIRVRFSVKSFSQSDFPRIPPLESKRDAMCIAQLLGTCIFRFASCKTELHLRHTHTHTIPRGVLETCCLHCCKTSNVQFINRRELYIMILIRTGTRPKWSVMVLGDNVAISFFHQNWFHGEVVKIYFLQHKVVRTRATKSWAQICKLLRRPGINFQPGGPVRQP